MDYAYLKFIFQNNKGAERIEVGQGENKLQFTYTPAPNHVSGDIIFRNRLEAIRAAINACDEIKQCLEQELK